MCVCSSSSSHGVLDPSPSTNTAAQPAMGASLMPPQTSSIFGTLLSLQEQAPSYPASPLFPSTHFMQPCPAEWLPASPAFPSAACRLQPCTIAQNPQSGGSPPTGIQHTPSEPGLGPHSSAESSDTVDKPSPSVMQGICTTPSSRSLSMSNISMNHDDDDGSVACKLLSSITKSISSPLLRSCCKESVRETAYQKALRLKTMKLQHCAEELGSESSDTSSTYGDGGDSKIFKAIRPKNLTPSSSMIKPSLSLPSMPQEDGMTQRDPSPVMVSVRSAPNLGCPPLVSRRKERSFPPPLSHRLPRSSSMDAFTVSVRACREDGRLVLKEVKVPCRHHLHANRENGCLTIQLYTADNCIEPADSLPDGQESDASEVIVPGDCLLDGQELDADEGIKPGGCVQNGQESDATKCVELGDHDGQESGALISQQVSSNSVIEADKAEAVDCNSFHNEKEEDITGSHKLRMTLSSLRKPEANSYGLEFEVRDSLKERQDEASLSSIRKSEAKSSGFGFEDDSHQVGGLSAKCLLLKFFNAENSGMVDEVPCVNALHPSTDHAKGHLLKNQSSACKRISCLSVFGDIKCTGICSNHNCPRLKVSQVLKFDHCEENTGYQSRSRSKRRLSNATLGLKAMGKEITPAISLRRAEFYCDKRLSPTIIFKDVGTNSFIGDVAKLLNSFGLQGAKWYQGRMEPRELEQRQSLTTKSCHHHQEDSSSSMDGIRSIKTGVKNLTKDFAKDACGAHIINLASNRKQWCTNALEESCNPLNNVAEMKSAGTIQLDLQLLPLNSDWLHSSHCKELLDRRLMNKGFPCVAIRS